MQASDKTMLTPSVGAEATIIGTPVKCPVCGTENAPTEKYCGDCGFLLSSTPAEAVESVVEAEQAKLIETAGQREHYLRSGENSVGREGTDVLLGDPTVSRRHALVILDGGKCWVQDLGSTNGTSVNGKPLPANDKAELSNGSEVKFGSAVVTLSLPQAAGAGESVAAEESTGSEETVQISSALEAEEAPVAEETPFARLISSKDPSAVYSVAEGSNTVGRRSSNDIILTGDPYVSGAHAEIVIDNLGIWLVDVGSTNGTMLNGSKISANSRMALNNGDEITFGQSAMKFEIIEKQPVEDEQSAAGHTEEEPAENESADM